MAPDSFLAKFPDGPDIRRQAWRLMSDDVKMASIAHQVSET